MKLETFINENYDKLNSSDKEILSFISRNRDFVQKSSIAEVAKKSLFSKSSIFRLCTRLGLTGFSQLKYLLQDEIQENINTVDTDYISQTLKSVLWTVNQFKGTKVDEIYETIKTAQNIYIYATGWEQHIVTQQLQRDLYLLGRTAFAFPCAGNEMSMNETNIKATDVLIVISYSGMSESVLKMVQNFSMNGVKVISMTSLRQNKIAQASDYCLYYDTIAKNVPYAGHQEQFFSDLHLLVDLFCMGFANYLGNSDNK